MRNKNQIRKIGRTLATLAFSFAISLSGALGAGEVQFDVEVDQNRMAQDDQLQLRFTISSSAGVSVSSPQFKAPEFERLSQSESVSIQSYYDSSQGGFQTSHKQQITVLLHPLKSGQFKISDMRVIAAGKEYRARDIWITVLAGSAGRRGGAQPGMNLGGIRGRYGTQPSLGGIQGGGDQESAAERSAKPVFLKAEVDKTSAYRGEQIIVSYYLFHRARLLNVQPEKYPVLNGFLREDLEIPVTAQRLASEPTIVGGVPYEKTLLARYAAYPLENRDLEIDSMSLKVNFYVNSRRNVFQDDDPFFGFFQQMAPKIVSVQSDLIKIQVKDLPSAGKPNGFSGGVGQFSLITNLDKNEVRANEAITFSIKVSGKGNPSGVQEPVINWPDSVEMYESKGKINKGPNGASEKVFEYLLIPRVPGQLNLPTVEMSFFDPEKKEYYHRATQPLSIHVLPPAPGSELVAPKKVTTGTGSSPSLGKAKVQEMRYLKQPEAGDSSDFLPSVWRLLYWGVSVLFIFFLSVVGKDLLQRVRGMRQNALDTKNKRKGSKQWEKAKEIGKSASRDVAWNDVVHAYNAISYFLFEFIESKYGIQATSTPLQDVGLQLESQGFPKEKWDRLVRILEFSDQVRYARSGDQFSEAPARTELSKWISEAETIVQSLS